MPGSGETGADADADAEAEAGRLATLGTFFGDPRFVAILLVQFTGLLGSNAPPPALADMATALSVSDARIGLVMTAFTLPGVVAVPVIGVLVDIYGRKRIVIGSLFLLAVGGVGIAFVQDFRVILLLRALQGVGFAGSTPLGITLIGDVYPGEKGSTGQGFLMSASGVSSILVPAVAGFLVGFGWEYAFLLYGVVLVAMAIVYLYLPETLPERASVDVALGEQFREYWRSIRHELRDLDLAVLFLGAGVEYFVKYGLLTFLPLFAIRELGASVFLAGVLISLYGAVRVVVSPLSGTVVSRLGRKRALVVTTGLVALGTGAIGLSPSVVAVLVPVTVYSVGDALLAPVINDAVATRASKEHRGGVVSGLNMLKNVGKTIAPVALGAVLVVLDFAFLFVASAALMVGYVALAAVLFERDGAFQSTPSVQGE